MLAWRKDDKALHIAVIGDLILDEYIDGIVSRISPEAPVPVHLAQKTSQTAGGAANAARNISLAGGKASLFGLCGQDPSGDMLIQILEDSSCNTSGIIRVEDQPTIRKTRISSGHQQMIRIDWEKLKPIAFKHQEMILEQLAVLDLDAILISDYGKGGLSSSFIQSIIELAHKKKIKSVVDPKGKDFSKYKGCDLITPNLKESCYALNVDEHDSLDIKKLGCDLQKKFGLNNVLITMGAKGMTLVRPDASITHKSPQARDVFDVSGAGDTVAAVMTLALAAKLKYSESMHLANLAAGLVVEKWGTQSITYDELQNAVLKSDKRDHANDCSERHKIKTEQELLPLINHYKNIDKKIVFTNGCFDLMHAGHSRYLQEARSLGDLLIVAINSDNSVKSFKGEQRPIVALEHRSELLSSLACVDYIVVFSDPTPLHLIQSLRPDVLVKGADYKESEIVGAKEVKSWGGSVERIKLLEGLSSSHLVEKIRSN